MTFSSSSACNFNERSTVYGRPARHIACPQRLKYIHNINHCFIPYVEDSTDQPQASRVDGNRLRTPHLGLFNTTDAWQNELMSLAQQVQSTIKPSEETQRSRLSYFQSNQSRKARRSMSSQNLGDFKSNRRSSNRSNLLADMKPAVNDESTESTMEQDHGIWLLPILCHVLHIDTISEAQQWLVQANPTEKRLAMELISRTMLDLQYQEQEFQSEFTNSEPFFAASNFNKLYIPYKCWQRQHKKKTTSPWLSTIDEQHEKCERATSPLRLVTPILRLSPTGQTFSSMERSPTRASQNDRIISSVFLGRRQPSRRETPNTVRQVMSIDKPDTPVNNLPPSSRQSYRVKTSQVQSNDEHERSYFNSSRGKTPLV